MGGIRGAVVVGGALALAAGCSGAIGPAGGDRDGAATAPPGSALDCSAPPALAGVPARILTSPELVHALAELFPDVPLQIQPGSYDGRIGTFIMNSREAVLEEHVHELRQIAEATADQLVGSLDLITGCAGELDGAACAAQYLPDLARRAFRRPLENAEEEALLALYAEGAAATHAEGMRYALEAVLQAPSFLYVFETSSEMLAPMEVAQRLAATFARSIPDDALLRAAEDGSLLRAEARVAHAERLLDSPAGRVGLRSFVSEWMGVATIASTPFGVDEPELAALFAAQTQRFVDAVIDGGGQYPSLLSADYTYVNEALAAHYGIDLEGREADADGWYRVPAPGGLLAQGSWLSVYHGPVHRGLAIRSSLLCRSVPGPDGIDITTIQTEPGEAERSKAAKRLEHPTCGGCHTMMDPTGLVFDRYDDHGIERDTDENDNPLSSEGALHVDGEVQTVADPATLGAVLVARPEVEACVAEKLFTWTYGRLPTPGDGCMVGEVEAALSGGGDLRAALLAIVASPEYVRRPEGSR